MNFTPTVHKWDPVYCLLNISNERSLEWYIKNRSTNSYNIVKAYTMIILYLSVLTPTSARQLTACGGHPSHVEISANVSKCYKCPS